MHTRRWVVLTGSVAAILALALPLAFMVLAGGENFARALHPGNKTQANTAGGSLPLSFEPNVGQMDGPAKFLSRNNGYTLFLSETHAIFDLPMPPGLEVGVADTDQGVGIAPLKMELVGADPDASIQGEGELEATVSYFIGADPALWRTRIPTFGKVVVKNAYHGIDVMYRGNRSDLEYDFVVAPGADPRTIGMRFAGALNLQVNEERDLELLTNSGRITFKKPRAYQVIGDRERVVDAGYAQRGPFEVGFRLGAYDQARPLVIDPVVIVWSTFLGGSVPVECPLFPPPLFCEPGAHDMAYDVAESPDGSVYVVGTTRSTNFPTKSAFQDEKGGLYYDIFVAKFSPKGNLVYSTYLGGDYSDWGVGIRVDKKGRAHIVGGAGGPNFPMTKNAFATEGGLFVVAVLGEFGDKLLYSTRVPGAQPSFFVPSDIVPPPEGGDIALFPKAVSTPDPSGIVFDDLIYITGVAVGGFLPTENAFQEEPGGFYDAFVAVLDPSEPPESALLYSTYLGGSNSSELGFGIATDATGKAYVTGWTDSDDFPTLNPYQSSLQGGTDAFITVLDPKGPPNLKEQVFYSTYLGGSEFEGGVDIAVDGAGHIYVTGRTESPNFPTENPLQGALAGSSDAFVTRINPTVVSPAAQLVYSTFLGGTSFDIGSGIAVQGGGTVTVGGTTLSGFSFPGVPPPGVKGGEGIFGAVGGLSVFVTKLATGLPPGFQLLYTVILGGSDSDIGAAVARDNPYVYVVGATYSGNFPSKDAYQPAKAGSVDAFVTKLQEQGENVTIAWVPFDLISIIFGETIDMLARVINLGPTEATSVTLEVRSRGLDFEITGFSATQGTCAARIREIIACDLGTIGPGDGVDVSIQIKTLEARARGKSEITLVGKVSAAEHDTVQSDNDATATIVVLGAR